MTTQPRASTPLDGLSVAIGELLGGKYRIEGQLGRGGMGVVLDATHADLGRRVAIKMLLPQALQHPEVVERFLREGRASTQIRSEHVVQVLDVGRLPTGEPYLVMERLTGQDLSDILKHNGPLAVPTACELVLQACEAIGEAHALGIVHRDLKPSNLFITQRADGSPCAKVLDFGISKMASGVDEHSLTATHATLGTLLYASPEQLMSPKSVDARADIWSLGVLLYEALTGHVPFMGETMAQVVHFVVTVDPPLPSVIRPDLPPGLDAVLMRTVAKKREERTPNVAELALALSAFAPSRAAVSAERISRVLGVDPTAPGFMQRVSGTVVSPENPPVVTTPRAIAPTVPLQPGQLPPLTALPPTRPMTYSGTRAVPGLSTTAGANVVASESAASESGPRRRATLPIALAVGVVVGLGGIAAFKFAPNSTEPEPKRSRTTAAEPDNDDRPKESKARRAPAETQTATEAPSAIASASASASASVAPTHAPPSSHVKPPSHAVDPAPSAKPITAPVPTVNCATPFYFDSDGIKHYKPECNKACTRAPKSPDVVPPESSPQSSPSRLRWSSMPQPSPRSARTPRCKHRNSRRKGRA